MQREILGQFEMIPKVLKVRPPGEVVPGEGGVVQLGERSV